MQGAIFDRGGGILDIRCRLIAINGFVSECEATVVAPPEIVSQLRCVDLNVTHDYYNSFRRQNPTAYKVAADAYLFGKDQQWMDKSLLCPEMALPSHLTNSIRLFVPSGAAWTKQAVALVHAGRTGCIAPVHFDWDHSWVAHACLMGRKRFFLFPPQAGWLLNPIINTSALCIPRFSESDRREIINLLGGTEVVLTAGQGILFPSMFWHGTLYDESSLSISVRFEPCFGGRPFAALPRSWLLQRLIWRFFREGYGSQATEFLKAYLTSFFQERRGWKNRYRRLNALCRESLLNLGEEQGAAELVSESFSAEIALCSQELKASYDLKNSKGKPNDDEPVREVANFIFEPLDGPPDASQLRLAAYAMNARQGLPPKRGLVEIQEG